MFRALVHCKFESDEAPVMSANAAWKSRVVIVASCIHSAVCYQWQLFHFRMNLAQRSLIFLSVLPQYYMTHKKRLY